MPDPEKLKPIRVVTLIIAVAAIIVSLWSMWINFETMRMLR